MTIQGVCIPTDPAQMPTADELAPFELVRVVCTDVPEFYAAVRDYQAHGLAVAVVLAWETFGGGNDPAVWADTCDRIFRNCSPELTVIGNEEDAGALGVPSPASWSMTPAEYAKLWLTCETAIRRREPSARLCLGGAVAGQPWLLSVYLREVRRAGGHPDAADIHPYTHNPRYAGDLLELYRKGLPGLEIEVLEWNRPGAEVSEYVQMLERVGVEYASFFSLYEFDIPGLIDRDGNRTDLYQSYTEALSGAHDENGGTSMSTLEQREQSPDWPLGPRWHSLPIEEFVAVSGAVERHGYYELGDAIERAGDVWCRLHTESVKKATG